MEILRSRQNAQVKRLRALFSGNADDDGLAVVEGEHLVQEALRSGAQVREIFLREDTAGKFTALLHGLPKQIVVHGVAIDVFDSAVGVASPQGIAAVVAVPSHGLGAALSAGVPLLVVLDGVQDPGNVGTIIRSAEAFGASAVVTLPGTANAWGLKVIRASAGSVFRLPFFALEEDAAESLLRRYKLHVVAAVASGGAAPSEIKWQQPAALLVGSEGAGLLPRWLGLAESRVTLPTGGAVESLNAAVAASLLLYEASKARGNS
jgi:RNA methyltransferase, TrmH family